MTTELKRTEYRVVGEVEMPPYEPVLFDRPAGCTPDEALAAAKFERNHGMENVRIQKRTVVESPWKDVTDDGR